MLGVAGGDSFPHAEASATRQRANARRDPFESGTTTETSFPRRRKRKQQLALAHPRADEDRRYAWAVEPVISVELLDFRRTVREARGGGSLIRAALHQAIADHLEVVGDVLDLGGGENASYRSRLRGEPVRMVSIDAGPRMGATFALDLEEVPLPFEEASYDTILAFNLLEHIYHYRELLDEMHRLLRPGGQVAVFVPFLIGYHPDPRDHFRYTDETLARLLSDAGFTSISVQGYGGRLSASINLALGVVPSRILRVPLVAIALMLDGIYYRYARTATPRAAPLGYLATARR